MKWTAEQIVKITGGCLIQGESDTVIEKFTTDSRQVAAGSFFIPLKGPRFDGQQFIENASQEGAIGYFKTPGIEVGANGICIEVEDPLTALQKIAKEVRNRFKGPVVAITGSNGKTTTKEMLSSILTEKYPILKSEGNFNNHIGLPLTLLNLKEEHRVILLEMGINHAGELRVLCEIARPTLGLITSIGETHLEGLGSIEGVAEAKGELLDFLHDGIAVLNRDSPFFSRLKSRQKGKAISFGLQEGADIRGVGLASEPGGVSFAFVYQKNEYPVHLSVSGSHNVLNALGATGAALMLGCFPEEIVSGLTRFTSVPLRSETIYLGNSIKVIADAYNANPSSMKAALEMLADMGREEKRISIAILGDMLELGSSSENAHYQLGQRVSKLKIDRLLLYGSESKNIRKGAIDSGYPADAVALFSTHESIANEAKKFFQEKPVILIKGSRGMKMEKVLEYLK
ncbi:MAG: UDP-N-acetylmuramoyl-tripeptide--D-alanyl-D-alanine ligase [Nitrospiria bacterium]